MRSLLLVKGVADACRYHRAMARLFILFLIALLPLRGWTAERMTFQMAPIPLASAAEADVVMGDDCAVRMHMAVHHDADPADGHTTHHGCQACQLCMPLAALDAASAVFVPIPQALPVPQAGSFVSADTAPHAKPPIS